MLSSSSAPDNSKLAIVAEMLIEAAASHVESTHLEMEKDMAESLKKLALDSSATPDVIKDLKVSFEV